MNEQFTVVTRKGQITVPVEIRRALNLQVGDTVALSLQEGETDRVTLRRVRSIADRTFGSLASAVRSIDDQISRERFMEAATERDERTKPGAGS